MVKYIFLHENSEIVIALINKDEATLEYLQNNQDGAVTLLPANQTTKPVNFMSERIRIQGMIVGQMRSYQTGNHKPATNW